MAGRAWAAARGRFRGAHGAGERPAPPTLGRLGSVSGAERRRWLAGDAVALLSLAALTALVWLPAFGTRWVLVAVLGGAVLGLGVGVLATLRRWGPVAVAAAGYGLLLLLGAPLVAPGRALAGVLPTPRLLLDLAAAPVTVWRGMLTIAPPLGETGVLLAGPLLVSLLASCLGVLVSTRSGASTWAWLPSALGLVAAGLFGAGAVRWPVLVGVGFLGVVLVWTAWRRRTLHAALVTNGAPPDWRGLLGGALVLAVAGGVALLAAPGLAPAHRVHLREQVSPPLDPHGWPSPLQGFRRNIVDDKARTLFTVTGLPAGARVRLAALDTWDGLVAGVGNAGTPGADAGTFRRVGAQVPGTEPGHEATLTIKVDGLDGVWLPTVGAVRSVTAAGGRGQDLLDGLYYNRESGTGVVTTGLRKDDEYQLRVVVPDRPTPERVRGARAAQRDLPAAGPIPNVLRDYAAAWTREAATSGEMAQKLEARFREGFYSNGQEKEHFSMPGHSAARVLTLLASDRPMVGDEEQYSVAMALMARSLGLPARVVYGYAPGRAGTVAVTGEMVSAWVEVALDGLGWVEFNPTPPRDRTTDKDTVVSQTRPRPQVDNPPPPPVRPEQAPPEGNVPLKSRTEEPEGPQIPWEAVRAVALYAGVPFVLFVAPVAFVVGLKLRRRRRRRFAPDPALRIAGGWDEIMDRARDLGARPVPGQTRSEQAVHLTQAFPRLGDTADPAALAREADAAVFAPEGTAEGVAVAYWQRVRGALDGLGRSRSRWRRFRAVLSLASLRRRV